MNAIYHFNGGEKILGSTHFPVRGLFFEKGMIYIYIICKGVAPRSNDNNMYVSFYSAV